jgi:hypothetical protein
MIILNREVAEHVLMIDSAEWPLEVCGTVAPNQQKSFRKINAMLTTKRDQDVREWLP